MNIVHKSSHGQIKNSFLQLGIVSGFVDLFETTSNFYIAQPELSTRDIIILVVGTEVMVLLRGDSGGLKGSRILGSE